MVEIRVPMLTAALVRIDEENDTAEKITFAISLKEDLKGGAGKSHGQSMNEEKMGGEPQRGAVFGWSYNKKEGFRWP